MSHASHGSRQEPKVGDKLRLRFGTRDVIATVIEDRGPIGVGGRRLVRVRVVLDPSSDPLDFEVPAEDLRPRSSAA